ncbi:hypothetical protein LRP67_20405 [Nocardioides sp. cx-169]|uniref:hypothetical protein n=1 Tax=Nocardioides sp. cx-169 TaxID=2899080 RepID=UPI001E361A5F|nr:hypothetical protein [Nocardioides sp. cx-169]MCD4536462.1 hypothetical protein [Nocardioides sp. cx-169]
MSRRIVVVVAVVVGVAIVVYAVMYLNRGDTSSSQSSRTFPAEARGVAFVDEAVIYDDLGRMTATADLVVRGSVRDATAGKTHVYPPSEALADETDRLLTVQVEEVVYSDGRAAPKAITVVEGWWSQGVGYAVEGMPWIKPGQQAYFYLTADPGYPADTYTYVGTTGRVLLMNDRAQVSGDHHGDGPWDGALGGRARASGPTETADGRHHTQAIEGWIRAAAVSAQRGESKPMPLPRITGPKA